MTGVIRPISNVVNMPIYRHISPEHESVLVQESIAALDLHDGQTVVDATAGQGGHSEAILHTAKVQLIALDADAAAVASTRVRLQRFGERLYVVEANFRDIKNAVESCGHPLVDRVLFDLGWNRGQLTAGKGFSFQNDEPLLMTYGESGETAADIVNSSSEEDLADLIFTYGEERFARPIACAIVAARAKERILTTGALVAAIVAGTPRWYQQGKTHPATKTFQALRIAVNDEIAALRDGMNAALAALAPDGRFAAISFHSIEDRIVKNALRDAAEAGLGAPISKKPVVPSRAELLANRRARSAKLRVFERAAASTPIESAGSAHRVLSYA